jgi:peptidoglycan/xylan/chitin deacetylase (PgdA/CDA1 family)
MWSADPLDYRTTDIELIKKRVLAAARPGLIVLSHDSLAHSEVAYRTIIPALIAQGFTLVTVDELMGAGRPGQLRAAG